MTDHLLNKCAFCDSLETTWMSDPYDYDVHGDDTEMWICESCAGERSDEI